MSLLNPFLKAVKELRHSLGKPGNVTVSIITHSPTSFSCKKCFFFFIINWSFLPFPNFWQFGKWNLYVSRYFLLPHLLLLAGKEMCLWPHSQCGPPGQEPGCTLTCTASGLCPWACEAGARGLCSLWIQLLVTQGALLDPPGEVGAHVSRLPAHPNLPPCPQSKHFGDLGPLVCEAPPSPWAFENVYKIFAILGSMEAKECMFPLLRLKFLSNFIDTLAFWLKGHVQ